MYPEYQKQDRQFPVSLVEAPDTSASFIDEEMEDPMTLTGYTKASSRIVLRAYLKAGFIDSHVKNFTNLQSTSSVGARLLRIINNDYAETTFDLSHHYYVLRRHGKIDFTLRELLDPIRRPIGKKPGGGPIGAARIAYSKKLCRDLVRRYGTRLEVVRRTHVPMETLHYWLVG